jgi:hypothetical protein
MKRIFLILLAAALGGCYDSSGRHGDAGDADVPDDAVADETADLPPDCPPVEDFELFFTIDGVDQPMSDLSIEEPCTVQAVTVTSTTREISLQCTASDGTSVVHTVVLRTYVSLDLPLWEGGSVVFRYVVEAPWWSSKWFSIGYEGGGFAVLGVDASSLFPERSDMSDFYAPLTVSQTGTSCPPETEYCYDSKRLALDVAYLDEARTLIVSGTQGSLAGTNPIAAPYFRIAVQAAYEHTDMQCTDIPPGWFKALFILYPGD